MSEHRFLHMVLYIALVCLAVFLFFRFFLSVLLPFFIAFLLSQMTEPAVTRLQSRCSMPRAASTALIMSLLFAFLSLVLFLLLQAFSMAFSRLTDRLPALLEGLRAPMDALQAWLLMQADRVPDGLGLALRNWVTRLFSDTSSLLAQASDRLLSLASRLVGWLPKLVLFLVTTIVASFMISAQRPSLLEWLKQRLPTNWVTRGNLLLHHLRKALTGWLRAEVRLMLITFGMVSAGLWILGAEAPLLLGAVTALVDALPVLGTGTVLIPWGIWSLLQGQTIRGVGLLLLYGLAAAVRTTLEPRLVGRQIGLHPLLALLSMYAGFQLFGLGGMILLPIAAILARQLWVFGGFSK